MTLMGTPPQEDHAPWDFWDEARTHCVSYNSAIDLDLYRVFCRIVEKKGNSTIATELGLPPQYVELLQSILCSMHWCDYGSSPRHCFIDLDHDAEVLRAKLLDYLGRKWNMDGEGAELSPPHPEYESSS